MVVQHRDGEKQRHPGLTATPEARTAVFAAAALALRVGDFRALARGVPACSYRAEFGPYEPRTLLRKRVMNSRNVLNLRPCRALPGSRFPPVTLAAGSGGRAVPE